MVNHMSANKAETKETQKLPEIKKSTTTYMKTYIIVEFKCFSDPSYSGICRNDDVKNFHCQRNFFFFER